MKLILKNSSLVFAKNIQSKEVTMSEVGTQNGVYSWSNPINRLSVSWNLSSTTNTKRIASNPIEIERTKYNKFKIEVPSGVTAPTYFWFVFAGAYSGDNGQVLVQSSNKIVPGVLYNLEGYIDPSDPAYTGDSDATFKLANSGDKLSFDGHISALKQGNKVQYIALNVKVDETSQPTMDSASDFDNVKIVLMP